MPDEWRQVRLGDVAEINPQEAPPAPDSPFVPMGAITAGERFVTPTEVCGKRLGTRCRGGDLLFARITPCLENGKVAQLPPDVPLGGGSTELIVVRAGEAIDPAFLFLLLTWPVLRDRAAGLMVGSTGRQRLAPADLANLGIDLPPLRVQRRIADLFDHIDRTRDCQNTQAARARDLRSAVSSVLWRETNQVDLAHLGEATTGQTPSTKEPTFWAPPEVPFVAPSDFDGHLTVLGAQRSVSKLGSEKARLLGTYSVAQVCIGATIGKAAVLTVPAVTNQQINAISGLSKTDATIAAALLASHQGQSAVMARAGQTTLPIIKKSSWVKLRIPWPAREERERIAGVLTALDSVERAAESARARLDELKQSLLGAWFSGVLSGGHEIPESYDRLVEAQTEIAAQAQVESAA